MKFFSDLLGFKSRPSDAERETALSAFTDMQDAIARETPEQKQRFYLGVAALLGNQSAADQLRRMDETSTRSVAEGLDGPTRQL